MPHTGDTANMDMQMPTTTTNNKPIQDTPHRTMKLTIDEFSTLPTKTTNTNIHPMTPWNIQQLSPQTNQSKPNSNKPLKRLQTRRPFNPKLACPGPIKRSSPSV